MPISKERKAKYPHDWQDIRQRILARAAKWYRAWRKAHPQGGPRTGRTRRQSRKGTE